MSNLGVFIKKFSVPAIFLFLSFYLLKVYDSSSQDSSFLFAAIMMFVAAVLNLLFSFGVLSNKIVSVLGYAAGLCAIYSIYLSYKSVSDSAAYIKNYNNCKALSVSNLSDIRGVQKAYREKHGTYAPDWKTFLDYLKNGTVPEVLSEGSVPSRKITTAERDFLYGDNRPIDEKMSSTEAWLLSKCMDKDIFPKNRKFECPEDLVGFVRDTVQVSLLKTRFIDNASYVASREKSGFSVFNPDSLIYIPYTGGKQKWSIKTLDSVSVGGTDKKPTIRVFGQMPFAKLQGTTNEFISFGKLNLDEISGSWEEE